MSANPPGGIALAGFARGVNPSRRDARRDPNCSSRVHDSNCCRGPNRHPTTRVASTPALDPTGRCHTNRRWLSPVPRRSTQSPPTSRRCRGRQESSSYSDYPLCVRRCYPCALPLFEGWEVPPGRQTHQNQRVYAFLLIGGNPTRVGFLVPGARGVWIKHPKTGF
jgi:hypothetical protein